MAGVIRLEVVHEIPGRVRWRCVIATADKHHYASQLDKMVSCFEGVKSVRWNSRINSLTVLYHSEQNDSESLALQILNLTTKNKSSDLSELSYDESNPQASAIKNEQPPTLKPVLLSLLSSTATQVVGQPLKLPISLVSALPVLKDGVEDLFRNGINSHVLEALAVSISLFRKDYFTANATSFMLALGGYLEQNIQYRSDEMLKHLLAPSAKTVWVVQNGSEKEVPISELQVGDEVVVSAGELIPIDGTVLKGMASVNEAALTGESVPVSRGHKDRVYSGSLVQEGRLHIYAENVGEKALIARIANFVQSALDSRSNIQLEATNMADRLVPLVLALSAVTYLASGDWRRLAAVLQADYSCALKLSTPVAFKSAMYEAGRRGVLAKSATALEGFARADTFVFDKTGTLSTGQLEVTDVVSLSATLDADHILNMAASVEEHSIHPIAEAVVLASKQLKNPQHFDHKEVEFVVAHGVVSTIQDKRIVVGSRHFLEDHENIPLEQHNTLIDELHQAGKALLYIAWGGEIMGIIALRDGIRHNAKETLKRLRDSGVKRLVMLSGDHPERAQAVGDELGLDLVYGGLLPQEKSDILKDLSQKYGSIVFVGDGVNDAPALSIAGVGVSMHNGADVARVAADVVLLEDDFARIADMRELSVITERLIKSNFGLTAILNSSILLAAASGKLQPVATSVLHNGSTIAILLRAFLRARLPTK